MIPNILRTIPEWNNFPSTTIKTSSVETFKVRMKAMPLTRS